MNAVCVFDFTINKTEEWPIDKIKCQLNEMAKEWVFQKEKGELGHEHYQGRLSLKVKKRIDTLINQHKQLGWHWSITSNENKDNDFYVMKEDTRIEGPWKHNDKVIYIPRQIRDIELRPWQQYIVNDAKIWDTRTINILIDESGNNGKSTLKTYIGVHNIGRAIPFSNDYKDIMRMVMDTEKKPLYIIDIPRALRKDQLYQFFSGIETLKDGYAFDDRYSFREEYFDCPNIWIFMNVYPDLNSFSKDRWVIWTLNSGILSKDAR